MRVAKKIVASALSAAMIINCFPLTSAEEYVYDVWDGSITTDWLTATAGTEDDPYIIDSSSDLAGLAQLTLDSTYNGFKDKHFEITANLDLNNLPWLSIGGSDKATMTNSKINFATVSPYLSYLYDYGSSSAHSESLYKIKNECFVGITKANTESLSGVDIAKMTSKQQYIPLLLTPDGKVYVSAYKKDALSDYFINSLNIGQYSSSSVYDENNSYIGSMYSVPTGFFVPDIDCSNGVCVSNPETKTFTYVYDHTTSPSTIKSDFENHKVIFNDDGSWDYYDGTTFISDTSDTSPYWISIDGTEMHIATSEDKIEWVKTSCSLSNPLEFSLSDFNSKVTIFTNYIDAYFSYNITNDDGSEIIEFNGNIDGKNARIKNLKSATSIYEDTDPNYYGEDYIHGLFGLIGNDATVENFVIENATIETMTTDYNQIGVGSVFSTVNKGTLNNIHVLSCEYPSTYTSLMGGITGINFGTIKNSYFACETITPYGNASSYMPCGGIAGYNAINGLIDSCVSNMTTPAKYDAVGGIAGLNEGTITNCENIGTHYNKDGAESCSGGIVGVNGLDGIVENCTNNGILGDRTIDINYLGDSAGIAGRNLGQIKKCLNKAEVIGNSAAGIVVNNCCGVIEDCVNIAKMWGCYDLPNCAAGIASTVFSGTIRNCHNFGELYNDTDKYRAGGAGGIAGVFEGNNYEKQITIENCNNYGDVYGYSYGAGVAVGDYMFAQSKKYIKNCNNYGNVSSTYSTCYGGVIGAASCAEIENCNSYGNLTIRSSEISPDSFGDTIFYGGFASNIRDSIVRNCQVIGDLWCPDNLTVINCAGFIANSRDSAFINCGVVDTNHNTPIRLDSSSVYSFANQNYNCEFTNCFADVAMQYDLNPDYSIASGFAQANPNNIFKNCYSKITNPINLPPKNDEGFLGSWSNGVEVRNCFYLNIEGLLPLGGAYNPTNPDGTSALDEVYTFEEGEHLNGALAYRLDKGSEANRTTNWTVVGEHQIVIDETIGDFNFQKTINIPSYTGFATETYKPVYKQTIGTITGNGVLASTGLANSIADATDEVVYLRAEDSTKFTHTTEAPNVLCGFTYGDNVPVPDSFTMPANDIVLNAEYKPLYNITIGNSANGTTTVDKNSAFEGDTVTVNASADVNYILKALKYNNVDIDITGNTYTFTMPAEDVVINATYKNTEKYISEFILAGETASISGTNINVTIPYGVDISDIAPDSLVYKGDNISPNINDKHDFTRNVQYTVTAEDGSTITYNVNVNRSIVYGDITINLTTEDNIVNGRKFEVIGSDNNKYSVVVDENGTATITVPLYTIDGASITYRVTEINKPVRYEDATEQAVTFNNKNSSVVFDNNLDKKDLIINYENEDNIYTSDVTVTITGTNGYSNTISFSGKTYTVINLPVYNSNDEFIIYTATQSSAPVRYTENATGNTALDTASPAISLYNELCKSNVVVNVVKDRTVPFQNIEVQLLSGATILKTLYSDASGNCVFSNYPVYNSNNEKISYTIKQVTEDNSYLKPYDEIFELDYGTDTSLILNNINNIGTLTIKLATEDNIVNDRKFLVASYSLDGYSLNDVHYNLKSNSNGFVSIELPMKKADGSFISYKVTELDVPIRYGEAKTEYFNFSNSLNHSENIDFNDVLDRANLEITYSNEDNRYTSEIEVTITGTNNYTNTVKFSGQSYTVSNLVVYNENDEYITYTVSQNEADVRYILASDESTELKAANSKIALHNSVKRNSITVNVRDNNGNALGETSISLYCNGSVINTLKTDINGVVTFDNLLIYDTNNKKLKYEIRQKNEVENYLIPSPVTTELYEDKAATVTLINIYNLQKIEIQLNTEDGDSGNRDVIVEVSDGKMTLARPLITDENGKAEVLVPIYNGVITQKFSFKVIEKNKPIKYGNAETFIPSFKNGVAVVEINNVLVKDDIVIKYSSEDGDKTAEFKIIGTDGYKNTVSTTTGNVTVSDLRVYDKNDNLIFYTIEQLNVPVKYEEPLSHTTDIKGGVTVSFINVLKRNNLTIKYNSEDGNKFAEFKITGTDGYKNTVSTTTGNVTVPDLRVYDKGNNLISYTIEQINVSTKYETPLSQNVNVENDAIVAFDNILKKNDLTIIYNSEDGNKFAEFKVTGTNGYENTVFTTTGSVTISELRVYDKDNNLISYTVEQLNVPTKYESSLSQVTNVEDDAVVTFSDTIKKGSLIINPIFKCNGEITDNVRVGITITSTDGLEEFVVIDDMYILNSIPIYDADNEPIQYTIEITGVPKGYIVASAQTTLLKHNDTVVVDLINEYNQGNIKFNFNTLTKDMNLPEGYIVNLFADNGKGYSLSSKNEVLFENLPVMKEDMSKITYTAILRTPGKQFVIFENHIEDITLVAGETVEFNTVVTKVTGDLQVNLNTEDNNANNFTITLKGSNDSNYEINNANKNTLFKNLDVYDINNDKIKYEIIVKSNDVRYKVLDPVKSGVELTDFEITTVVMDIVNKYSDLTIILKDKSGAPIGNGKFEITLNDEVIYTLETDENGVVELKDLLIYSETNDKLVYKIAQIGSEDGYELAVDQLASLAEDSTTIVEFINNKPDVPSTPGDSEPDIPEEPIEPDTPGDSDPEIPEEPGDTTDVPEPEPGDSETNVPTGRRIMVTAPLLAATIAAITGVSMKNKKKVK